MLDIDQLKHNFYKPFLEIIGNYKVNNNSNFYIDSLKHYNPSNIEIYWLYYPSTRTISLSESMIAKMCFIYDCYISDNTIMLLFNNCTSFKVKRLI